MFESYASVHKAVHGDGHEVHRRVLRTCEEMLRDRGCARVERLDEPALRGRDPDIDVHVLDEERVSVKAARAALDARAHDGVQVVIVSLEGPTPFARRECGGGPVQFFCARDLCVNVTRHALVPKHERVENAPVPRALMPRILDTDRVVQYHNWPVGTVVRVWRCFGGHEPVPYFRVVTAAG